MPGRYSLSVRSLGKWDLVTLMRQGNAARIQVRMKFRPESDRPSALFLQRAGEQRELSAKACQSQGSSSTWKPGKRQLG